jgi:hypothetical protein
MFLDTVNTTQPIIADRKVAKAAAPVAPFEAWKDFPHSHMSHHGKACCETAREWFLSMDHALLAGESSLTGPRWIRSRYDWGPSAHPIHWCEAVKRKTLDCGALAALSIECFKERGVPVFPAQFVQSYSKDATAHWRNRWADDDVSAHWLADDLIYHEGCAVLLPDGTIRLWDASAAWWMNPEQTAGYGGVAALKIWTGGLVNDKLQWGRHRIPVDEWTAF